MADVTVFANFFIDTRERYLRMMDSYRSFCDIQPARWVINIRGRFRNEAADFLRGNIKEESVITFKHSKQGWFHDTGEMLPDLSSEYVFFWIEDHINIGGSSYFRQVLQDMKAHSVDIMCYSVHRCMDRRFRDTGLLDGGSIWYLKLDLPLFEKIFQRDVSIGCFSCASIMKTSLFRKIILFPTSPSERTWRVETPFDFERLRSPGDWLPLVTGMPKEELFAAIDDDRGWPDYSLQQRGLYPVRETRWKHVQWRYISAMGLLRHVFKVMPRNVLNRMKRKA